MAQSFGPQEAYQYLVGQGYPEVQAAAIAGNIQQESSFNPTNLNKGEGAFGLIQWRLDRRQALEDFARQQGKDVSDPYVQLDFIGHEMRGSEARNAAPFLASSDLEGANAALKRYIRYGDKSDATRLNYANLIMSGKMGSGGAKPGPVQAASTMPAGLLAEQAPSTASSPQGGLLGGLGQPAGLLAQGGAGPVEMPLAAANASPSLRRNVDLSRLQAMLQRPRLGAAWSV